MATTMMWARAAFEAPDGWVGDFLSAPRLATFIAGVDGAPRLAHLPLHAVPRPRGGHRFESHCPAADPFIDALRGGQSLLVSVMGPRAFISSSWCLDRARAPTWNYIAVALRATARMQPADEALRNLARLAQQADRRRPEPWSVGELGATGLARRLDRIACFELDVQAVEAKFKLGQDEPAREVPRLVSELAREGHRELAEWMSRALAEKGG